jgi:hypothetical protein
VSTRWASSRNIYLRTLALTVALAAAGVAAASGAESPPATMSGQHAPNDPLSELDALHARRDDRASVTRARAIVDSLLAKSPNDFAVLWRAARVLFTESEQDHRPAEQRGQLGKQAYDLAGRAIAAGANRVEGYYWGALAIGSYGSSMGMMRALANGIEGKFKTNLERAAAIDIRYDHGGIPVTWAAYYLELPWPKRDRKKAAEECRRALAINPANLRARLYLARIALAEDHPEEARARLDEIASAPGDRYDPPEERVVKREAAAMRASLR